MADLKDILFTILKWGIIIFTAIILVLITIDVINTAKTMETETVVYVILTYLVLLFGFFGAYQEEFLYAVIFGIGLILDLIYAVTAKVSTRQENKGAIVGLTIAAWVFAFMIKFAGSRSISIR